MFENLALICLFGPADEAPGWYGNEFHNLHFSYPREMLQTKMVIIDNVVLKKKLKM